MHIRDYSRALADLLDTSTSIDHTLAQFRALLERKGQTRLYPRILRATQQIVEKRAAQTAVTVTVARTVDADRLAPEISAAAETLGTKSVRTTTVDTSLIGGFTVESNHTLIDRSFKRTLLALYRSVTE